MTFPIFIKAGRSRISVAKEIKQVNRLRLQYERSLRKTMYNIFRRVGEASVAEYLESGSVSKSFIDLDNKIGTALRAHYTEVIDTFGNRVFQNRKMERFGQLIFQLYAREGAAKVTGISSQTRNQILKAIKIGEKDGIGVRKTAKLISERTKGAIARSRATTIARTETHAAASYATHEATKELNLPLQKKRWVSVSDSRTRSGHSAANGQEVGIDEKFIVPFRGEGVKMNYPHDGSGGAGNNINCRCVAIYFTDEDSIYDDVAPKPVPVSLPSLNTYDIEDVIVLGPRSKLTKKMFTDKLNLDLSPLMMAVAVKLKKPNKIESGSGVYYRQDESIKTDLNADELTLAHELGHHIDVRTGLKTDEKYWSIGALANAINEDARTLGLAKGQRGKDKILKKFKEELFDQKTVTRKFSSGREITYKDSVIKFKGSGEISDIVDAFMGGRFRKDYDAYGHSISYWKRKGAVQKEIFANMYSLHGQPKGVKWMKKNIPITYRVFIKHMKEIAGDD